MSNIAFKLFTLATMTNAKAAWNYAKDGNDWPDLKLENDDGTTKANNCGGTNQSPIDLPKESDNVFQASKDNFQKWYDNKFDLTVKWNGHTSQIDFNTDEQDSNTFQSQYSVDVNEAPRLGMACNSISVPDLNTPLTEKEWTSRCIPSISPSWTKEKSMTADTPLLPSESCSTSKTTTWLMPEKKKF